MWLNHGVRLVWVVQPETRSIDVYRIGQPITTLGDEDALDGLDVLPGFTCDVSRSSARWPRTRVPGQGKAHRERA